MWPMAQCLSTSRGTPAPPTGTQGPSHAASVQTALCPGATGKCSACGLELLPECEASSVLTASAPVHRHHQHRPWPLTMVNLSHSPGPVSPDFGGRPEARPGQGARPTWRFLRALAESDPPTQPHLCAVRTRWTAGPRAPWQWAQGTHRTRARPQETQRTLGSEWL